MAARLGDMPLRCMTQPIELSAGAAGAPRQTYIQTSHYFAEPAERAKRQRFRVRELLSAGHDAMITQPDDLARILLDLLQHD